MKKAKYSEVAGGELVTRNLFINQFCNTPKKRKTICSKTDFLDNMCALSTFHVMKTVRLGLDVASNLIHDYEVNNGLKYIYIAR